MNDKTDDTRDKIVQIFKEAKKKALAKSKKEPETKEANIKLNLKEFQIELVIRTKKRKPIL